MPLFPTLKLVSIKAPSAAKALEQATRYCSFVLEQKQKVAAGDYCGFLAAVHRVLLSGSNINISSITNLITMLAANKLLAFFVGW